MIQLAFYRGRMRLFDRLVQWWTRGPYSHCEIILERTNTAAFCVSSSWRDGGVRGKWIALDAQRWDIVQTQGDADAARAWMSAHVGKRYDILGLFGFVIRPMRDDKRRWFCSEMAAAVLGFPEPWRFSPNDLAAILKKKERA